MYCLNLIELCTDKQINVYVYLYLCARAIVISHRFEMFPIGDRKRHAPNSLPPASLFQFERFDLAIRVYLATGQSAGRIGVETHMTSRKVQP